MSDDKKAWMEKLGVSFRDDWTGGASSGPGTSTVSATSSTAALPATETVMFFKSDEADLTPDDRTALDSYAAQYVAVGSADPVKVEGWASVDGVASRNEALSKLRAQKVAEYLSSRGIPNDRISARGMGPTDQFDNKNHAANRRATIAPSVASIAAAPAKPDPGTVETNKAPDNPVVDEDGANAWIRDQLKTNGLRPDPLNTSGTKVMYKNRTTSLTDVISDTVVAGLKASIKSPQLITPQRVQRIAGEVLIAASPGGGKVGGKSLLNVSIYLQYQFIPKALHTPLSGGPGSADQPASQVQFQITAELHGKDESGIEISGSVSGTFFADEKGKRIEWQSASGGAQIGWVQNFLDGNLQVGPQLQISFGGSRALMNQTQRIEWTPTGQISAGAQAQFKVPGFSGHLLVGWQAGGSLTLPAGAKATADRSVGFTLTYQF